MAKKNVKEEINEESVIEEAVIEEVEDSLKDNQDLEDEIKENVEENVEKNEESEENIEKKCDASSELENLKSSNIRITAEFQNYKKRVEKEKADIYKFANEKLIVDILPVMDDFDRAVESFSSIEGNEGFTSGIEMIKKSLNEFMKKNSVEKIESVGKPFDPNFHHAVMSEESGEYEEETVIAEFQKGYTLNGRVIRPAMVKVSK